MVDQDGYTKVDIDNFILLSIRFNHYKVICIYTILFFVGIGK